MGIVGIAMLIMAVTLVVLAGVIIPTIIEIRKTVVASRETLGRIEADLRPILQELQETVTDVKLVAREVSARRENLAGYLDALNDTGKNIRTLNSIVGTVMSVASNSSLWLTGVKVAGKYAFDRILRKGEKKHVEQ